MSLKPELRLDWCSHEAAKYAVEHWHYSGTLPTPPYVRIGAWERGKFVGCVIFGRGNAPNIGRPFGLKQVEVCELVRVALRHHDTPVTRIVTLALKILKKLSPGLRLVVSFADPRQGHVGTIYQAGNWAYLGTSQPTRAYVDKHGREWHSRMVSPTGMKKVYGRRRRVVTPSECTVKTLPGKHKYVMPLDDALLSKVAALRRPYPKRPKDQAPGVHPGLGGETPTRPLQLSP